VTQRAIARRALIMVVPYDSHRGRQYQHDQQDGDGNSPDSRWFRHRKRPFKPLPHSQRSEALFELSFLIQAAANTLKTGQLTQKIMK
jgi:hypothetical protein